MELSVMDSHVNELFNSVCYRLGGALVDPGDEWDGFRGADCVLLTHALLCPGHRLPDD